MVKELSYVYKDYALEKSVRGLKSTFYDVIEREEIILNNLENEIAASKDENTKNNLLDLWTKHNNSLDNSILLFRQLQQSIQVIDQISVENDLVNQQVISNTNNVENKLEEEIHDNVESVSNNEDSVQPVEFEENVTPDTITQNSDISFDISPNNDEKSFEEVPNELNDVANSAVSEEINSEDATIPDMARVDYENDGVDLPTTVEADSIDPATINETEKEVEPVQAEDNNQEENVDLPFKDVTGEANNLVPDATITNSNEDTSNTILEQQPVNNEETVKTITKNDDLTAKVIIVNDNQFNNLANSKTEEEKKVFEQNTTTVEPEQNNLSTSEPTPLPDVVPVEDNVVNNVQDSNDIEKMLEKANELYKEGKAEEAKALYDEISVLNNSLNEKNKELVKTM